LWALVITAIGVAVVFFALVVLPALLGRGEKPAVAIPSGSAAVTQSTGPGNSPTPSPSSVGTVSNSTPAPQASYQQYTVQSLDTATKIAKKFGLKTWELLLANPNLAASPDNLRIGSTLNIPKPGQLTPPPATPTDFPAPS
jgi:LysM repeat protein